MTKELLLFKKTFLIKRTASLLLSLIIVCFSVTGCVPKRYKPVSPAGISTQDQAETSSTSSLSKKIYYLKKGDSFSFVDNDISPRVTLTAETCESLSDSIKDVQVDFIYDDLYDTENAFERLNRRDDVEFHQYNATDNNGNLSADRLCDVVKENNQKYLEAADFGGNIKESFYEYIADDKLLEICKLIVDSVNRILLLYPDIDRDRVYCTLGDLKVFYCDVGMSFASVNEDRVVKINRNIMKTTALLQGEGNEERDILIHEVMHLVQHGCPCEHIPDCEFRAGISKRYDDDRYNSSFFDPLIEGSAEKCMSNITGDKELTYSNYINYIDSLDVCTMMDNNLSYNYIESISFYDDPQKLYDVFHAATLADKIYAMKVLMTINLFQNTPEAFLEDYAFAYQLDKDDEATSRKLHLSIKPDIALAMSKLFFGNLSEYISDQQLTQNDLCCLINIWESRVDKHLSLDSPDNQEYNSRFLPKYTELRKMLFDAVSKDNGINFDEIYSSYDLAVDKEGHLNACMESFSLEEREFLLKQVGKLTNNFYIKISE